MSRFTRIIIIIMIIATVTTACAVPFKPRLIKGSGNVIVEDRKVSGRIGISVDTAEQPHGHISQEGNCQDVYLA